MCVEYLSVFFQISFIFLTFSLDICRHAFIFIRSSKTVGCKTRGRDLFQRGLPSSEELFEI
jgi:hypothetical protein